jgi:1-acyl-sn-glycerol-3-phosphate acyltransferase
VSPQSGGSTGSTGSTDGTSDTTAGVPVPGAAGAATARNLAALALRAWALRVSSLHLVPVEGPVLLAANHVGFLDGLVLVGSAPRPVHVLASPSLFRPPWAGVLRASGQIAYDADRPDRVALHAAVDVLQDGGAVAAFPEAHRGAGDVAHVRHGTAYLAHLSGAPVVPVAVLGTRPPGGGPDALPRWRSRLDVVFGEPVDIRASGDPRRRAVVARTGERLRQVLADHVRTACRRTGQDLPGPIPARSTT